MQKTQGHRLKDIWEVEDAVANASQSAKIAKQYHQLTAQNVSAVSLEIDRLNQKVSFAVNEISRLEGLLTDSRNTCLVWGVGGAIVASFVMALFTAQFNPPQKTVIQQEPVQSEIVEPVPQIQKPRIQQPKAIKPVARRHKG